MDWIDGSKPSTNWKHSILKHIEDSFSQFSHGKHSLTKAFEADDDYIGLTDDYDFCWGPENEGELLEGEEYTDRLWGVYTKTAGEIYLLKANEDLSDWEREEPIIFAPTGSQKATIEFNNDGHYEIAVELTPAGEEISEIWLLSYPYQDENIKKICNGTEPQLFFDHNKDIVLFYTDNEQLNICYRFQSEDYETEYSIDNISESEKKHLKKIYKVYDKINDKSYYIQEIVFYNQGKLRYIKKDIVNPIDDFSVVSSLANIAWEDMRYLVNFFAYNIENGEGVSDTEITIEGQKDQPTLNISNGDTVKIISYDTVYDVILNSDSLGEESSFGILIDGYDETKEMDINLPFLLGKNKLKDSLDGITPSLNNIVFESATYDIYVTVYNADGDIQSDVTVTFEAQREQEEVSAITDSSGEAHLKVLPYDTVYDVTLSHDNLGNYSLGVLINGHDNTYSMEITLFYINPFSEELNLPSTSLDNIAWEDMTYELDITLSKLNGTVISDTEITIEGQRDQADITVTTDSNGQANIPDIIPYDTVYDVSISHSSTNIGDEKSFGVLIDNDADKHMEITLNMLEEANNFVDIISSISNNLSSILWVEV